MAISLGLAFGLMIFQGVPLTWHILLLIPVIAVLYVLSFGIGTILMHFGVTFDDLANLSNIGLRMLFYLSGVFYNIKEKLKGTVGFLMIRVNPVAFLMNEARKVCLYGKMLSLEGMLFWLVIGLIISAIGISIIHKYENSYAKVI
jgi:ABC-type polysaccharide/polyol phosphate export permease